MDHLPVPTSQWPSTSYRPFFLYDTNHPASLHASVVEANRESQTYIITYPTSCASSDFPEQTITHIQGSSWAGERVASGSLTVWGCDLGRSGSDDETTGGWCYATTMAADEDFESPAVSTAVHTCFVESRSVLAVITAGMDKLYEYFPYWSDSMSPEDYISAQSEALSSLRCTATSTATAESESETESETGSRPNSRSALFADATETAASTEATGETGTETESEGAAAETGDDTDGASALAAGWALVAASFLVGLLAV